MSQKIYGDLEVVNGTVKGTLQPSDVSAAIGGMDAQQVADVVTKLDVSGATPESVAAAVAAMTSEQISTTRDSLNAAPLDDIAILGFFLSAGLGESPALFELRDVTGIAPERPMLHALPDAGDAGVNISELYKELPTGFSFSGSCSSFISRPPYFSYLPLPRRACAWYDCQEGFSDYSWGVTQAHVDAVLARFVALLPTYGATKPYINLTGCPAPSEQGMDDVATLQAAGCTVLVSTTPEMEQGVEIPDDGTPVNFSVPNIGGPIDLCRGVVVDEVATPDANGDIIIWGDAQSNTWSTTYTSYPATHDHEWPTIEYGGQVAPGVPTTNNPSGVYSTLFNGKTYAWAVT